MKTKSYKEGPCMGFSFTKFHFSFQDNAGDNLSFGAKSSSLFAHNDIGKISGSNSAFFICLSPSWQSFEVLKYFVSWEVRM